MRPAVGLTLDYGNWWGADGSRQQLCCGSDAPRFRVCSTSCRTFIVRRSCTVLVIQPVTASMAGRLHSPKASVQRTLLRSVLPAPWRPEVAARAAAAPANLCVSSWKIVMLSLL